MALLEQAFWQCKELPLSIRQAVLAPEVTTMSSCYPTSPPPNPSTTSQDSGFNSRPLSPNSPYHSLISDSELASFQNLPFPSQHLLVTGKTGFSLGVIACDKGTMCRLSVPLPEQLLESQQTTDVTAFTLADITAVTVAGEAQLWIGMG